MALSQPWRFTVLVALPLAVFVVTYLLAPLYAKQPVRLGVLPILFLIEAVAVGLPALAILALVRRPALFVTALATMTAATTAFGVWEATSGHISDGQGGLALLTPIYVGVVAGVVLGILDWILRTFGNTSSATRR
ncbi:MAG: hypothetical protein M3N98_09135 [Actinomycetota bacterium]|nr:hypothetical protein [Actinomycetota bacterium]